MRDGVTTGVLCLGLIGSLLPSMSFPATMPAVVADLHLGASQAGWIGGIYFAGYAGAVPLLSSLTDRIGAKPIYLLLSVLGAAAGLAFASGRSPSGPRWRCASSAAWRSPASTCRASSC